MPVVHRPLPVLLLATSLLMFLGWFAQVAAQEASPTPDAVLDPTPMPPPVSVFLEAEGNVETLPAGPATISVSRVFLAPRVALRAIVTNGPVLILVESGILTIDTESAIIGSPPSGTLDALQPNATPAAAPATNVSVPEGTQILLTADTRVQLRNTTDEEIELLITAIAPAGEEGFGEPTS